LSLGASANLVTLEQMLDAYQLAHADPSGRSANIMAGRALRFAPEPERNPKQRLAEQLS
jgi:hypothetical protein